MLGGMRFLLVLAGLSVFGQNWPDYGGGADASQYSALTQIHKANVGKLKRVWTYPTGDSNKYFFNPLMVDGTLYVMAKGNSIVALDAASRGLKVALLERDDFAAGTIC